MKFKISNTQGDFLSLHKAAIHDPRISFRAKGVYAFLRSLHKEEGITVREMSSYSTDGVQGTKSALKELHIHKYIKYNPELKEITILGNPNINNYEPIQSSVKKKSPKPKKTKEQWLVQRRAERDDFIAKVRAEAKEMKAPKPELETIKSFAQYWSAVDSIDPSREMPFQKKQKKTGVFNIKLSLRSWMRKNNNFDNNTKDDGL